MNHLILVKHSLPEVIPAIPANRWRLSPAGQDRCKTLAKKLTPYAPDLLIASTEPKAVETAQILARQMDKSFHSREGLQEHDRTGAEFLERERFEAQVHRFFEHPEELVMGRETANQARARFSNVLTLIEAEYTNKSIVVVAHGTVITLFVEKAAGLEPFPFWKKLGLPSFVVLSLPDHELLTVVEGVA